MASKKKETVKEPVAPPADLPAAAAAPVPPPEPVRGAGRFVFADGSVYEGEWMMQPAAPPPAAAAGGGAAAAAGGPAGAVAAPPAKKRDGRGRFSCSTFTYEGGWEDDVMHGQGTYVSGTGARYSGMLVRGVYEGHGEYRWPDGATYKGGWAAGLMHGDGAYIAADGVTFAGQFYQGNYKRGKGDLVDVRHLGGPL